MKKPNQAPIKNISKNILNLPTPTSISYMWNWGSMLGIILAFQLISGILLASHYNPDISNAFNSIVSINRDISQGNLIKFMHMNFANMFFTIIFIHISRGLLFSSFNLNGTWISGSIILLTLMATAFLGYVLPWGQMSFWGATVITNLLSAIPYMGSEIVQWLWGGFSINMATLNRFFTLHFMLPFVLIMLVLLHLMSLHSSGSSMPISLNPNKDKMSFHPYYTVKDMISTVIMINLIILISLTNPLILSDPENFNPANPLNTPNHIQPEWYFLFAYAILRSIPNKLGGVIALMMAVMSLMFLVLMKKNKHAKKFTPLYKLNFWMFSTTFLCLTWIGSCVVEPPYENLGKIFSSLYFWFLFLM